MIQIDIPMPKGCWTCPWFQNDWNKPRCTARSQAGRRIEKTFNLGDNRQTWCPLKTEQTTTWLGSYTPYTCEHCGFHVDSKTRYCPDCGRRATDYEV